MIYLAEGNFKIISEQMKVACFAKSCKKKDVAWSSVVKMVSLGKWNMAMKVGKTLFRRKAGECL